MAGVIEMVTPADVLREAERVMLRPWDWARDWHCLGDAADVFKALWGVDPIPGLRGIAPTYGIGEALILEAGCLDNLAEPEFRAAGLKRLPAAAGAIAIGPSGGAEMGGRTAMICVAPGRWVGKTGKGLGFVQRDIEGWLCI